MKAKVITFPGSNCDDDCVRYFSECGVQTEKQFYQNRELSGADLVIVPGGFSYGDYLRAGAIASRCPIMEDIKRFSERGGWVIGICNGFQILTEAGLLPGALIHHPFQHFLCKVLKVKAEKTQSPWIPASLHGKEFTFPMANAEGRFMADQESLKRIEGEGWVAWRYLENFNDSKNAIAGIAKGRVLGMMPHPERSPDGAKWLKEWLS